MKESRIPGGARLCRSSFITAACLFTALFLCFPFCWGAEKAIKMPIQKQASQSPAGPARKAEAPVPQGQTPPAATLDFELEMKKVEALIQVNDKNAEAYFNRGCLHVYKGDTQKALQDFSKAIELNKGMKDAFYNRGIVYLGMKKFEEATRDFSEVIRLEPTAADGYCNRGNIHFRMGKLDLALADYNSGLKADPQDADLLYNRAAVHFAKGDKAAAIEDLKSAGRLFHDKTRKEFPELASQPPAHLKNAALEGQVLEFLGFMPEDLRKKVQGFEATRKKVEKAVSDLEQKSKQILGEKFQRKGNTLAFSIVGTDPRWTEVFGPKWPEMIKQNPSEPKSFYMPCEFGWKEEIQVLQRLQACLENPSYCQEAAPQNSFFYLKRTSGVWKLVDAQTTEEWNQMQVMGDELVGTFEWANNYLSENQGKMADEEMLIGLAKAYMQKVMAMTAKVKPAKKSGK